MAEIQFHILQSGDTEIMQMIAGWYLSEWNIPVEKTIQKLRTVTADRSQFQVVMKLDDVMISTGGVYNHVGLLDKEPRFRVYKNWLALVYTIPEQRQKGYGALICEYIQEHAKSSGVRELYLFTDTAEKLYKRLGWTEIERLVTGDRNIVVMTQNAYI